MTAPVVSGIPQAFGFTAPNTPLTYTGGGATGSDVWDILFVISDATVPTPGGGWAPLPGASRVVNAGAYVFAKQGGSTAATIGPSVPTNTLVLWVRIATSLGNDAAATAVAGLDANIGSSSPALVSGALAEANEAALAFSAQHGLNTLPSAWNWSTGYAPLISAVQGSGSTGAAGSVAIKVPAGPGTEAPSVAWTGPNAERYLLFVAFRGTAAVPPPVVHPHPDVIVQANLDVLHVRVPVTPHLQYYGPSRVAAHLG